MKRIIILLLVCAPLFSMAQESELTTFEEIMESLENGESLAAVIYYGECQLISDNEIEDESIDAVGGMTLDTWEFFDEGVIRNKVAFVVSSSTHLIANPLGEGFVYNYVKIKISADGKVKITASYIDSITHEEIMTENFFTTIHDGNEGAAHFYIK